MSSFDTVITCLLVFGGIVFVVLVVFGCLYGRDWWYRRQMQKEYEAHAIDVILHHYGDFEIDQHSPVAFNLASGEPMRILRETIKARMLSGEIKILDYHVPDEGQMDEKVC